MQLGSMDAERTRAFLLQLPYAAETLQWGGKLVYWVGERAGGGRIFALIDLDATPGVLTSTGKIQPVLAFAAGPERFNLLLECEDILPAPHLARAHWVALAHWSALRPAELQDELRAAHARVFARLLLKTRASLTGELAAERTLRSPAAQPVKKQY